MRIAVPLDDEQVFQRFSKAERFGIYTCDGGEISGRRVMDLGGVSHTDLAEFLEEIGVEKMICGSIGPLSKQSLEEMEIEVFGGVAGGADDAVLALCAGTLAYDADMVCDETDERLAGHVCDGSCECCTSCFDMSILED